MAGKGEPTAAPGFTSRIPLQSTLKGTSAQVISELGKISGWNDEIGRALRIPDGVFIRKEEGSLVVCDSPGLEIIGVSRDLAAGVPVGKMANFGLMVEETASATYFTYCDMGRRIALRVKISSTTRPDPNDWEKVLEPVSQAAGLAAEGNKLAVWREGMMREQDLPD